MGAKKIKNVKQKKKPLSSGFFPPAEGVGLLSPMGFFPGEGKGGGVGRSRGGGAQSIGWNERNFGKKGK